MGGTRSSSRRYPRLRDRSIFVGNPGDLVDVPLGPDLPTVREWALERYAFPGYVSGSTPPADREALRAELGYRPDERVCLVTVGGSGVGGHLLRRAVEAFPHLERRVPGLRMIAVAGPRIDPRSIPAPDGVEVHWLTDAQHDRTGLAPDNVSVEPVNRRGPAGLPLKVKEWNRLTLSLAGDVVTLTLNDIPICERTLEATNQRVFGLFHYADETEARVRNVVYRGRWPREFPSDLGIASPPADKAAAGDE